MSSPSCRPAHRWLQRTFLLLCLAGLPLLNACTSPPDGVSVVSPFDVKRYAGQWFEIARLDHSFERGLSDVNATYRLEADGSVAVMPRSVSGKRRWAVRCSPATPTPRRSRCRSSGRFTVGTT
jgi:apolipoprotein D and lipocalin family protein